MRFVEAGGKKWKKAPTSCFAEGRLKYPKSLENTGVDNSGSDRGSGEKVGKLEDILNPRYESRKRIFVGIKEMPTGAGIKVVECGSKYEWLGFSVG